MTQTAQQLTASEYVQARLVSATSEKTKTYWQGMIETQPAWLIAEVAEGKRTLADATPEGRKATSRRAKAKKGAKTRKANDKLAKTVKKATVAKTKPVRTLVEDMKDAKTIALAIITAGLKLTSRKDVHVAMTALKLTKSAFYVNNTNKKGSQNGRRRIFNAYNAMQA